ncbi:MAG: HAMP domain-containing sensor histidine kinase [Lactimicrobium sp.]|uniref:sensor histidine kinase n=2 Tax=Lactimicrobium sp. TaxID=2563780 RepID=UPI002F350FA2
MKKKVSLKWKIGRYLIVFAAVLIFTLFVFQVGLLEPMYEHSKVEAVKAVGDEIVSEIDSDDLGNVILQEGIQNDACVSVRYASDQFTMRSQMCDAFKNMSDEDTASLIGYAQISNNKTYYSVLSSGGKDNGRDGFKSIVYARIAKGEQGNAVIMIYSGISPISATTRTLTIQLVYISLMILAAVVILTVLIYNGVAKPLTVINKAAKQLPKGEYHADPATNQYLEAQELNQTLQQAAGDIQKADKAKRDLIANVSHDLRTPLTMITGYGEMMRDLPGEKTDENIQVIIDESKRLNNLVNDLLDLSKLQENKIVLQKEDFDLGAMIEIQMRKYDVYKYQEDFVIEQEIQEGCIVHADQKRMEQVFNNFMINAINYSGKNKHIIVRVKRHDDKVRTEVQDFGEGIPEEKLKDIWDRYYKIDKEHVRPSQGSGIGLAIVKQVLDLHGFQYGVNSKVNEGSTFWFEIPLVKDSEGSMAE